MYNELKINFWLWLRTR